MPRGRPALAQAMDKGRGSPFVWSVLHLHPSELNQCRSPLPLIIEQAFSFMSKKGSKPLTCLRLQSLRLLKKALPEIVVTS